MAEEFQPITSQEELDKAIDEKIDKFIGKRLEKNSRQVREEFAGYISPEDFDLKTKEMTEQIASLTSQIEESKKSAEASTISLAEKDDEIAKCKSEISKFTVAMECGLSFDAIQFLQGNTEEEIRQSADSLVSLVGKKTAAPLANPETVQNGNDGVFAAFQKLNPNIKF